MGISTGRIHLSEAPLVWQLGFAEWDNSNKTAIFPITREIQSREDAG
jgi:hypothetical protein